MRDDTITVRWRLIHDTDMTVVLHRFVSYTSVYESRIRFCFNRFVPINEIRFVSNFYVRFIEIGKEKNVLDDRLSGRLLFEMANNEKTSLKSVVATQPASLPPLWQPPRTFHLNFDSSSISPRSKPSDLATSDEMPRRRPAHPPDKPRNSPRIIVIWILVFERLAARYFDRPVRLCVIFTSVETSGREIYI